MIVGDSGTGKTTFMVKLIKNYFAAQVNRVIVICPSFIRQRTFDPIRSIVKKEDIFLEVNNRVMNTVMRKIEQNLQRHDRAGIPPEKVLVIIDDLAGNSIIHGKRFGPFAHFAVQTHHWNVSLFVITQQPKSCDPNFRENAENIIVFPDKGSATLEWLQRAYTTLDMDKADMRRIIWAAWTGGSNLRKDKGSHFLFIHSKPRQETRFFIDFKTEINVGA